MTIPETMLSDNAIACANMAGNKDRAFEIAHMAFEKRGNDNPAISAN